VAGEALIADETGTNFNDGAVLALSPTGTLSIFATLGVGPEGPMDPFGMAFAPVGFGSIGGDLLVTDANSGNIYAVDSSGNVTLFATLSVPALSGGAISGLRQIAFAPAGYGSYGGDLFVSVSDSQYGGGTVGSVDILNSSGEEIGVLLQGTSGSPLDPRGLYFASNDQLLVSNADPSIISVTPDNFVATPEPSTMIPLALGALAILVARRRARKLV
jgi:hypothetical protein